MKISYAYILLSISSALFSCSKDKQSGAEVPTFTQHTPVVAKPEAAEPADPVKLAAEGKVLVEKSDCLSCHKINEKMIGPSYAEVAKKYTVEDLEYLSDKIIEGGSGVWGAVPMAAHQGLSKENSRKMVYYILSTK